MQRDWLEKFYGECGREVSLAYTVLNHSNNWAVGLGGAILGAILVTGKAGQRPVQPLYPNFTNWLLVGIAWVIMLRFFARSILALANMYRWNELIFATAKVLSVEPTDENAPLLKRNLGRKIDAYYFAFQSPKRLHTVMWHSAKLMYMWFLLGLFVLIVWGAIELPTDCRWVLTVVGLILATGFEVILLVNWHGLKFANLQLEEEPSIRKLWDLEANPSSPGPGQEAASALDDPPMG